MMHTDQDHSPAPRQPLRLDWRVVLLGWTIFGLFMAGQVYFVSVRFGKGMAWSLALLSEMLYAYLWAALTPLVVWLGRRYRLERQHLAGRLALHVPASLLFAMLHKAIYGIAILHIRAQASGSPVTGEAFFQQVMTFLDYGVLLYWMIISIDYAVDYYRRYQEKALRAAQLETQLAHAQLQALKMQLQPHFLFNTLNAISVLIQKDPELARQTLGRLSDLLRTTLDSGGVQFVTLGAELAFLDRYLQIERTRFGDRLQVEMAIAAETTAALIPNLILQPLVENAIRHGVSGQRGPAILKISAQRHNGNLHLEVRDNGRGLPPAFDPAGQTGIGLRNTRGRLEQLYGRDYRLTLANAEAGGTIVALDIPYRL